MRLSRAEQERLIAQFVETTKDTQAVAIKHLEFFDWDLDIALAQRFGDEPARELSKQAREIVLEESQMDRFLEFCQTTRVDAIRRLRRTDGDVEAAVAEFHDTIVLATEEVSAAGPSRAPVKKLTRMESPEQTPELVPGPVPGIESATAGDSPIELERVVAGTGKGKKVASPTVLPAASGSGVTSHISETPGPSRSLVQSSKSKGKAVAKDVGVPDKGQVVAKDSALAMAKNAALEGARDDAVAAERSNRLKLGKKPVVVIEKQHIAERQAGVQRQSITEKPITGRQLPHPSLQRGQFRKPPASKKPPPAPPAKPPPKFLLGPDPLRRKLHIGTPPLASPDLPSPLMRLQFPGQERLSVAPSSQGRLSIGQQHSSKTASASSSRPMTHKGPTKDPDRSSPPSSPPPPAGALANPDDAWNSEQRAYLVSNRDGGGLGLINLARSYEAADPQINNARSAILTLKYTAEQQLALMILKMDQHLLDAIIMGDVGLRVINGDIAVPDKSIDRPSLYVRQFVDPQSGQAPKANEMLKLVSAMDKYSKKAHEFPTGPQQDSPKHSPRTREEYCKFLQGVDTAFDKGHMEWRAK